MSLQQIKLGHGIGFGVIGYIHVRLHCLVVAVASPFHDYFSGDAKHYGVTDECAAASMAAYQLVLGAHFVYASCTSVVCLMHRRVYPSEFAEFLQELVHLLVADDWQCLVVLERHVLVLVKDCPAVIVQVYLQVVACLYGSDFDVIVLGVASAQVVNIRMAKSREAAEEKHVAHTLQNMSWWLESENRAAVSVQRV